MPPPAHPDHHYGIAHLREALIHFASGKVLGIVLGIGWILSIVRALPRVDYGAYTAFLAFLGISTAINSFGLIAIAERYVPEIRINGAACHLHQFLTRILIARAAFLLLACLVIAALSDEVMALLGIPQATRAFRVFQVVMFGEGFCRFCETVLDSLLKQKYSQVSILFRYGLRLATLIIYWASAVEPLTLYTWIVLEGACTSIGLLVSVSLLLRILRQLREEFPNPRHGVVSLSRMLRYAIPVYLSRIGALLSGTEMALILTTRTLGLEATAIFGFCLSLAMTVQRYLPSYLLIGMVRPLFVTAVHQHSPEARLNFLFSLIVKLNMFMLMPSLVLVLALGDDLVSLLSHHKLIHGGQLLAMTICYVLTQALRLSHGMVMIALEDGKGPLLTVLTASLAFYGSFLLMPLFGPYALMSGLIVGDVLAMAVARYRIGVRSVRLTYPLAGVAKMMLVALTTLFLALFARELLGILQLVKLAGVAMLSLAVYALLLWPVSAFSAQERNAINRALPRSMFVW